MSMFPHAITVYNPETVVGDDLRETTVNHITILRGVLVDATKAVNVSKIGQTDADSVAVYIPKNAEFVDGFTGEPAEYMPPMAFWRDGADRTGKWTLSTKGDGGRTFFIKGEVVEDADFSRISLTHDDVYTVTKVDDKDYGGDMAHWQVGGK